MAEKMNEARGSEQKLQVHWSRGGKGERSMSSIFETYGAREVLGYPVLDRRGREIGPIVDLVVAGDGRVSYAVVELAGKIQSGKLVGIPWRSLLLAPQRRQAAVNVDREALRGFPALDRGDWPLSIDFEWHLHVHD
jgi:PRC-barrel domain protein